MKLSRKKNKVTTNMSQTKISSFFQKKTTNPTNKSHLFTTVDNKTTKNDELTRLRTRSQENFSSLDDDDDPNEIPPTPEIIAKKIFGDQKNELTVLRENKITRKELKCKLFSDGNEKDDKTQLDNYRTKPVKRQSVDNSLSNPSKLSRKDELPIILITSDDDKSNNSVIVEETQLDKLKSIDFQSLSVIKETQFENIPPVVEETQLEDNGKLKMINLQSLRVIKETQFDLEKFVPETQFEIGSGAIDEQTFTIIKETQLNDCKKIREVVEETQFEESMKIDVNSLRVIEETQINEEINTKNKKNVDELLVDDKLLDCFDKMSPFKVPKEIIHKPKSSIAPFLTGLGRHVVINIEKSSNEIVLSVKSEEDGCIKTCILKDYWVQSGIKLNDIVNILSTFDSNQVSTIDNMNGLIIINPDHLITGTAVVSSLFCMRKSVFMERFRSGDSANFIMVVGSLVHQIFQEALCKQAFKTEEIKSISKNIVKHNSNLHAIYGADSTEAEILDEILKFIPQIQSWFQQYILKTSKSSCDSIKVTNIHDIEENIWSPRYGVKGKIDVTAQVEIHKRGKKEEKIIPLELKTGRSSFSPEHEGQVLLYSMMCSDRRTDPEGGLLVYLRDGKTKEVKAEHNRKRGLIQLRNELIYYLDQTVDGNKTGILPILPPPLNNQRFCSKCPYATICCLYSSLDKENNLPPDHEMQQLIPQFTQHLSETHKKYFAKWQHLLHLESSASKNFSFLNGIYCQTSDEREKKGLAFSQMKVEQKDSISETSNGLFMMKFRKNVTRNSRDEINIDVSIGEMVIISCEDTKEFAIASGTVRDVGEKFVQVEIDKNLSLRPDFSSAVFRLDRYTSGNITAIAAGSLLKLMESNESCTKLRRLIIDGEKPQFIDKLSDSVLKGKKILRKLNTAQTRAVIKSLTTQDYLLIKGMPGTGKTSTIVALVRLLDLLGYSVLLTSHTHMAVDNILIKLKNYGIDFLRLGKCSKIHPEIQPLAAEKLVQKLTSVEELKQFYESKKIFATTCLGVSHIALQKKRFDFCIVDEAAQIMQIICLGPLFYSNRFILIGDPLQLPPLVQNKTAKHNGMDQSLFSLLDSPDTTIDLNVQYRMNKVIMSLANELVYNGDLKCGSEEVAQATLKLQNLTSKSKLFSGLLDDSVVFLNTDQIPAPEVNNNLGIKNEIEAQIVLQLIKQFKLANFHIQEIGIISVYSAQVKHIRELMLQNKITEVEVNTVDQYQGRDKEVILVSFVRNTTNFDKLGEILFDIRRLNVAITRAKHKVILIGSISTLSNYPPIYKLIRILKENTINLENSFLQYLMY